MSDFIDSLIQSRKNGDYMYYKGRADERERIVKNLEELNERYLNRYGIVGNHSLSAIRDAIEIVRGGENE